MTDQTFSRRHVACIATLAAALIAEVQAFDLSPPTCDEEANARLADFNKRELEILAMPSKTPRDLAFKVRITGREYLENNGIFTDALLHEVDALIAHEPQPSYRDPDTERVGTDIARDFVQ